MEEMKGITTAISALGEKITELERNVAYERYLKEESERTLTARINDLQKEVSVKCDELKEAYALIEKMNTKLEAVNAYVERMEEK